MGTALHANAGGGRGSLRFDGRTVIVTGGGTGLGRAHAHEFARRGAFVIVNDPGMTVDGTASGAAAADVVVEEIRAGGGQAMASRDSVIDGHRIVELAMDNRGRIDALINNAGILRDRRFARMSDDDWQAVCDVHLLGAWRVTRAAWPHLLDSDHGRVVFTTSAAGLYGNFGQANYAAAKLALVGLMQTLAREGASRKLFCNAIAPLAATRLSAGVMPDEVAQRLQPECVAPFVAVLAHESCHENGAVFEVGAGWAARLRWQRSPGLRFAGPADGTAEYIAAHWGELTDFSTGCDYPASAEDTLRVALAGGDR